MKSPVFEVHIEGMSQGGHSIIIPRSVAEPFLKSKDKRVKIEASFKDKTVVIHSALQRDKSGNYRITFGQRNQKSLGIFPSDYFQLQLFEDSSKYGVEMPEELEAVLSSDQEAFKVFESFTPGKQRSIIFTILRYRSSQTRIDKSLLIIDNLKRGITDPKLWLK